MRSELRSALRSVAQHAVELLAQHALPALLALRPGTQEEGRLVANVLLVSAAQLRNPVRCVVLQVADDRSKHGRSLLAAQSLR